MTESEVDTIAQPVYGPWRNGVVPIETTILATLGQIELHLSARAPVRADAERALDRAASELAAVLGHAVISVDGRSLEAVVGDLLRAGGWTVAAAESCTGGLLTSRLTDVPGSSDYVERAAVCYSNLAKTEWLGVPPDLIAAHGAVSEPVARAMAEGVRRSAGSSVGVAVTGIAGPGGGRPDKPVGTVAIAVVTSEETRVRTFRFLGGREQVKDQAARAALNLLRLVLLGV
jgi:nicotinamide-nucleotide amidase